MDNIYVGEHYLFYYKSNEGRQGSSGNVKEKTTCSLSKECPVTRCKARIRFKSRNWFTN